MPSYSLCVSGKYEINNLKKKCTFFCNDNFFLVATLWKDKFEEAKTILKTQCILYKDDYKQRDENDKSDNSSEEDENDENEDENNKEIKQKEESKDQQIVIEKLADLNVSK